MNLVNSMQASTRWTLLGGADQVALGQGRCFAIGSYTLAIFRQRDGKVFALDATCPHRNGPLAEGLVGHDTIVCPFHGYKFSLLDGRGLGNEFAVNAYSAEVRDGQLFVRLPRAEDARRRD